MLKKHKYFILAVGCTVAITYSSLTSFKNAPKVDFIYISDKLVHGIFYFTLTVLWYLHFNFEQKNNVFNKKAILISSTFACIYGIIIEVLQKQLTSYRTADYKDALANSAGITLALLFILYFNKKQRLKTKK